jgi:hypothetical protein
MEDDKLWNRIGQLEKKLEEKEQQHNKTINHVFNLLSAGLEYNNKQIDAIKKDILKLKRFTFSNVFNVVLCGIKNLTNKRENGRKC